MYFRHPTLRLLCAKVVTVGSIIVITDVVCVLIGYAVADLSDEHFFPNT